MIELRTNGCVLRFGRHRGHRVQVVQVPIRSSSECPSVKVSDSWILAPPVVVMTASGGRSDLTRREGVVTPPRMRVRRCRLPSRIPGPHLGLGAGFVARATSPFQGGRRRWARAGARKRKSRKEIRRRVVTVTPVTVPEAASWCQWPAARSRAPAAAAGPRLKVPQAGPGLGSQGGQPEDSDPGACGPRFGRAGGSSMLPQARGG